MDGRMKLDWQAAALSENEITGFNWENMAIVKADQTSLLLLLPFASFDRNGLGQMSSTAN